MQDRLRKFLGDLFQDYRDGIIGDSYNFGPAIQPNKVQFFAFHHSVTPQTAKTDKNWKAECDRIADIHVNGNGWAGIGYRFVICSDGTIAQVGDLSHGGAAVKYHNDVIFSACIVGDFTKEIPTAAQIHSAHLLAKFFLTETPEYPLLDNWDDIRGHKEFATIFNQPEIATACPGSAWKVAGDNLYNRIKNDVWQGYPNPQPINVPVPEPPQPPVDPCQSLKEELEKTRIERDTKTKQLEVALNKLDEIRKALDS